MSLFRGDIGLQTQQTVAEEAVVDHVLLHGLSSLEGQ